MKVATNHPLYTAIRGDHTLYAQPELIVEWNLNRYHGVTASNEPDHEEYDFDVERFPIESIIEGNRPTKGVIKARINESSISNNYGADTQSARFYISDTDDIYKYWCSPYPANPDGSVPTWASSPAAITGNTTSTIKPQIVYDGPVNTNKIVIGFENTWASPENFIVYAQVDNAWVAIATNPTIQNDGRVVLYHTGAGWATGTSLPANATLTTITGIRVVVTTLGPGRLRDGSITTYKVPTATGNGYREVATGGGNTYFNLIEISARREENLTPYLISVDDTFDIGEDSPITPIGIISSNIASVTLSNLDERFNTLKFSAYQGLLDANAEFRLSYVYYTDIDMDTEIGRVQQFKMYSEGPWDGIRGLEINVKLRDASKYLQEVKPLPTMYENLPVEQIIWRICDQVGFVDYEVSAPTTAVPTTVPYWWTDGEKTAWELFNDLAVGTQTAVFFDGEGLLQIKNREAAFDATKAPTWHLWGSGNLPAGTLTDIENLSQVNEAQSNKITITYQTTDISEWNNGHPKLDVVWEPEDTVTLRSAELTKNIIGTSAHITMSSKQAAVWPYEGVVNIEGELIRYDGKQYAYYTNGTKNLVLIHDHDEYKLYSNKGNVVERYKNHFTGRLRIVERGCWNSEPRDHYVDTVGYSVRSLRDGVRRVGVAGFKHNKNWSTVSLKTNPTRYDWNDYLIATRGASDDQGWNFMGTRMKFVRPGRTHQTGGIVFGNSGTDESGYYLDIKATNKISVKERGSRNEIMLMKKNADGTNKRLNGKGAKAAVVEDTWFDIDMSFFVVDGNHKIKVWYNGRLVIEEVISGTNRAAFNGRFGMFAKGDTHAEYEYLYAINRPDEDPADDVSFFDIVEGGYRSAQWDREWVYRWRTRTRRTRKGSGQERSRFNKMFMDEFGPIIHEIREFDVKFEPAPVVDSRLFLTNTSAAVVTEYRGNPFGGSFVVANTSRSNAVLNGEDTIFAPGSGDSVNQILAVIGRVVTQQEAKEKVVEDTEMIRRHGVIETEISSPWIQSEGAANRLARWIKNHWSVGATQLEVTAFGNPLIELTDVVQVTHADRNLNGEKYYVTGISTSFKNGIQTTMTLRKVV